MDGGYKALVEDMKQVTDWAARHFEDVPIVLLGHSMGSMAARIYAQKYDWELSGMILCGSPGYWPLARPAMLVTSFLCMFNDGRMKPLYLQQYASSRFNRKFSDEGQLAWVCSDADVRMAMLSNPMTNFPISVNMMHNITGLRVA